MTYESTLGAYNIEMPDITAQVKKHIADELDAKIKTAQKFYSIDTFGTRYRIDKPIQTYQYPGGPKYGVSYSTDHFNWIEVASDAGKEGSQIYRGVVAIGAKNGSILKDYTPGNRSATLFVKKGIFTRNGVQRIVGSNGGVQQYKSPQFHNLTVSNSNGSGILATINSIYETLVLGGVLSQVMTGTGSITGIVSLWVSGGDPFKVKPKWADLAGDETKIKKEAAHILNTLGKSVNEQTYPVKNVRDWFHKFGLTVPQDY